MNQKVIQIFSSGPTSSKEISINSSVGIQADDFLLAIWCKNIVFVPKECNIILFDAVI